ncbi:MAG: YceI family protein [Bacteroidales bacterium]|nr:YceI family protein [Bacteroidales bacterium]
MKTIQNIFIAALLTVYGFTLQAQQSYRIVPEKSTLKVTGTSSLHDWEMSVEKFKCELAVITGNPSIIIEKAHFTGMASSVASHSSIMDKKAREALGADKHPEIKFTLSNSLKIPEGSESFKGNATGELTIAGKTKTVTVPFSGKINAGNQLEISGAKVIDMTTFGIDPPTAMLGSLKTGKDVKITFTINLQSEEKFADK